MAATYTTRDGDTVSWVCWRHYGRRKGSVEAVLAANPNLASRPAVLPAGVVIVLPELAAEPQEAVLKIWG